MFKFLKQNKDGELIDFYIEYQTNKKILTKFAIETAVKKIADVITTCGFDVITKNSKKNEIEYMLNIRPNANQNAVDFWRQVISKMLTKKEGALILNMQSGFFLAESFEVNSNVIKERVYSNITIESDDNQVSLSAVYKESDVIHLKCTNSKLLQYLKRSAYETEMAWSVAINGFKKRLPSIKVTVPANVSLKNKDGDTMTSNEYADKIARDISSSEVKAVLVSQGIDVNAIDLKSTLSSEDIKKLQENVFEQVAIAFGIPVTVLFGTVTEKSDANNEFITYACKPIIKELETCLMYSLIEKEMYLAGERILVNKLNVKHIDVIESAGNLDKLYQNGWSHNDVLKLLGLPNVNEDWANERRFTKNYASENELKGGE